MIACAVLCRVLCCIAFNAFIAFIAIACCAGCADRVSISYLLSSIFTMYYRLYLPCIIVYIYHVRVCCAERDRAVLCCIGWAVSAVLYRVLTGESISHKNGSIFVCYKSYFGLYFLANFDTMVSIGLCPPGMGGVRHLLPAGDSQESSP